MEQRSNSPPENSRTVIGQRASRTYKRMYSDGANTINPIAERIKKICSEYRKDLIWFVLKLKGDFRTIGNYYMIRSSYSHWPMYFSSLYMSDMVRAVRHQLHDERVAERHGTPGARQRRRLRSAIQEDRRHVERNLLRGLDRTAITRQVAYRVIQSSFSLKLAIW